MTVGNYNRFGAVYSRLIDLFPGTVVADFAANGQTGDVVIGTVMDRMSRDIARAMPPSVFRALYQVDTEMAVRYATTGQTTFTLGLAPVLTTNIHVWRYPMNQVLLDAPQQSYSAYSEWMMRKPDIGFNELASTDFSLTASTGAVALAGTLANGLSKGDRIFATYDVDVDNASFSMSSLIDFVLYGTAAELGRKLYAEQTQTWEVVTQYQKRYDAMIASLMDGTWIPDEIRRLHHWTEVERKSGEVSSSRLYRA